MKRIEIPVDGSVTVVANSTACSGMGCLNVPKRKASLWKRRPTGDTALAAPVTVIAPDGEVDTFWKGPVVTIVGDTPTAPLPEPSLEKSAVTVNLRSAPVLWRVHGFTA